jgi:hypothetical protein
MAYRGRPDGSQPSQNQHSQNQPRQNQPSGGRLTGPKRGLTLAFLTVLAVTLLAGAPAMIVFGVINLSHANQIRAHGVTTTATVLNRDLDYNSQDGTTCWGAQVSYLTAGGIQERSDLPDRGGCLTEGAQVRVVYDPAAPNVIQLASNRGDTSGGWGGVIMGSLFTVLLWGLAVWAFVKQRRLGVPRAWLKQPVGGGRGTTAMSGRGDI